jgi:sterol desaturase/sphingolipid hydroxylase (fatty acid hydroxylase superfamily)
MVLSIVSAVLLGVLTWTWLEYALHRWFGHDARTRPNAFESEHTRHHAEGDYFAATIKKVFIAVATLGISTVVASWIAGPELGVAYAAGLTGFYAFYEFVHRRAHTHRPINAYGRWLRRHHFTHHFSDPRRNLGVTSPLWDFVFQTWRKPSVIVLPRKLVMPWLVDAETGEVLPEYRSTYALRGQRAAVSTDSASNRETDMAEQGGGVSAA